MTILNAFLICKSCGGKMTQKVPWNSCLRINYPFARGNCDS